jgi:hypothetical protein
MSGFIYAYIVYQGERHIGQNANVTCKKSYASSAVQWNCVIHRTFRNPGLAVRVRAGGLTRLV